MRPTGVLASQPGERKPRFKEDICFLGTPRPSRGRRPATSGAASTLQTELLPAWLLHPVGSHSVQAQLHVLGSPNL